MSHLVPTIDYSGSPDPIAAIHAARLERQRRIAAAAWAPPPPPEPPKPEPVEVKPTEILTVEKVLAKYRLAVDTFDPVIDVGGVITVRPPRPAWPAATAIVSRETGVSLVDIGSQRRFKDISHARQLAFWLMKSCTKLSLPVIGRVAGGYDHTTVLHACRQVDKRRLDNPGFRDATARMRDELAGLLA